MPSVGNLSFGGLRWYDNFDSKTLSKYEKLSFHTCASYGRPAAKISMSWINPWCDNCVNHFGVTARPISEVCNNIVRDNSSELQQ